MVTITDQNAHGREDLRMNWPDSAAGAGTTTADGVRGDSTAIEAAVHVVIGVREIIKYGTGADREDLVTSTLLNRAWRDLITGAANCKPIPWNRPLGDATSIR